MHLRLAAINDTSSVVDMHPSMPLLGHVTTMPLKHLHKDLAGHLAPCRRWPPEPRQGHLQPFLQQRKPTSGNGEKRQESADLAAIRVDPAISGVDLAAGCAHSAATRREEGKRLGEEEEGDELMARRRPPRCSGFGEQLQRRRGYGAWEEGGGQAGASRRVVLFEQ